MQPEKNRNDTGRNRRLVSQLLVAALFAVAYSETVGPVSKAFDDSGVNLQSVAWLFIYMATVLRFFIGNILHLENRDLIAREGIFRWFWDLFFIVLQGVVLIFAGGVTTIESSAQAEVSFTDYLVILYALDVIWLSSMRVMDALGRRWPRSMFGPMVRKGDLAPLEWAIVSLFLGMLLWGLDLVGNHPAAIPDWKLWLLLGVNALVFLHDVVQIAYGIRDPGATRRFLARSIERGGQGSGIDLAISAARHSADEGGIPIGSVLMDEEGQVLGVGHNRRIQEGNPVLHAEMDCLASASRRHDYAGTVLYSTLMPCYMCAGAIIQFGIPRVVVGESQNFKGAKKLLTKHGVEIVDLDDDACKEMLKRYILQNPQTWNEDIGN
jgi:creatinine deaminase